LLTQSNPRLTTGAFGDFKNLKTVREVFIEGLEAAIEEKFADERKKESLKRGTERPVSAKLRTREELGRAIDKAAATVGLKPRTAEKGLAVLDKAEAGDPKAQALLESIDRDEVSVDRAYLEIKGTKELNEAFAISALVEMKESLEKCSRLMAW
jgi:hypothetical protein